MKWTTSDNQVIKRAACTTWQWDMPEKDSPYKRTQSSWMNQEKDATPINLPYTL